MIKATIIFDNKFASPYSPEEFLRRYYLTEMGNEDAIYVGIKQECTFKEITKKEE